eukprot:4439098-Heterocapsa_arctica.AAC.1
MCPTAKGTNVRALAPYSQIQLSMGSWPWVALPQSAYRSLKTSSSTTPPSASPTTRVATTRRDYHDVLVYRESGRGLAHRVG